MHRAEINGFREPSSGLFSIVQSLEEFFLVAGVADALKGGLAEVDGGEECGDEPGDGDVVIGGPDFGAAVRDGGDSDGDVFGFEGHMLIVAESLN